MDGCSDIAESFSTCFSSVRIINLKRRNGRRRETLEEFEALGAAIDGQRCAFLRAIEPKTAGEFPSIGVHGCFLSHLKVLEEAQASGNFDSVLIAEDDVAFVRGGRNMLPLAAQKLRQEPWDIAYFGHAMPTMYGPIQWMPVVGPMALAHCYAINGRTLPDLVSFLHRMLQRPAGHPAGGPMHYDGALSTFLAQNPNRVGVYISRNLAYQRSSRTDLHRPGPLDRLPILQPVAPMARWLRRRLQKLRQ